MQSYVLIFLMQDSSEFGSFLLDQLSEALSSAIGKDLFEGYGFTYSCCLQSACDMFRRYSIIKSQHAAQLLAICNP